MTLTGPFTQLLTMDKLPQRGALTDEQLEIIPNAGIVYENGEIIAVEKFESLKTQFPQAQIEQLEGDFVVLPGMIDVHTHSCWAGSRAKDYAMRLSGKSYQEIAASGGGIWDTVQKTRAASLEELTEITLIQAEKLLRQGITTAEMKSGYGLSVEEELKMLQAIKAATSKTVMEIVPTCLAAHILPKDFEGKENDYLKLMVEQLLPKIKRQKLANRVDIFVEKNAFSVNAARHYLSEAKAMGFDCVLHGNQFSSGTVTLANEVDALSIDHLETMEENEILQLAQGNCIPVVLPAASLGLGMSFAPARRLLNAGNSLVIASDWNPGSAPMGNLLTSAVILGVYEKLSMAEVWAALTNRAALALKKTNIGILKAGFQADFIAFQTNDFREILYHQGEMRVSKVWKRGGSTYSTEKDFKSTDY